MSKTHVWYTDTKPNYYTNNEMFSIAGFALFLVIRPTYNVEYYGIFYKTSASVWMTAL